LGTSYVPVKAHSASGGKRIFHGSFTLHQRNYTRNWCWMTDHLILIEIIVLNERG